MTAFALTTDAWRGVHANNRTEPVSGWEPVERAVRRLDGRVHTQVVLQRDDGSSLLIGGGPNRFNVSISSAGDRFFTLLDPTKAGAEPERLVAGGQIGDYPAETVVEQAAALRAAKVFYELGAPDANQDWHEY